MPEAYFDFCKNFRQDHISNEADNLNMIAAGGLLIKSHVKTWPATLKLSFLEPICSKQAALFFARKLPPSIINAPLIYKKILREKPTCINSLRRGGPRSQ